MLSREMLIKLRDTYQETYPSDLLEWGISGKSIESFAAEKNVIPEILKFWMKLHDEFALAVHLSYWKAYAYWEHKADLGVSMGKDFNSTTYSMVMRQRFKWCEMREDIQKRVSKMSDEDLEKEAIKILESRSNLKTIATNEDDEDDN